MKLQDILDQYHQDSSQASDIARNLNYALLGVVWILSKENIGNLIDYKYPLILIVISLASDFLQYFLKLLCLQHEKLPLSTEGTLLKFSFC